MKNMLKLFIWRHDGGSEKFLILYVKAKELIKALHFIYLFIYFWVFTLQYQNVRWIFADPFLLIKKRARS